MPLALVAATAAAGAEVDVDDVEAALDALAKARPTRTAFLLRLYMVAGYTLCASRRRSQYK